MAGKPLGDGFYALTKLHVEDVRNRMEEIGEPIDPAFLTDEVMGEIAAGMVETWLESGYWESLVEMVRSIREREE